MHSSGNLHHSKDVSTMWTDVSSRGQMRRRIGYIRTCDVDDARHIFFFFFQSIAQVLAHTHFAHRLLHSVIKSSLSEVFFLSTVSEFFFFFFLIQWILSVICFPKSVSRFRQRLWRYIGTRSIKGVVSAVVYVDPSTCRDLEELAFCVSYRCLDAVHEG